MRRNARKLVGTRSYFLRDRKNVALPELPNELWKLILETLASEYTFAMLFCEDEPSIVHWLFTFGCVDRKFYRVCNEMIDSVWTNKTLPICDYWSDRILRKCVHVKSVSLSPDFRTVSGTSLANLTQLTYLDAPLDAIADNTLALISLTALQSLKISECHRFSYCCLRSLMHLTDLDLSATATHVIGDALLRLTNVTTLNMNHQGPSTCSEIASMTQLRRLMISYSSLHHEENIFSRLINLQMLDLYGTPFHESHIRHLTNLRYLDIGCDETGIRWMHSSNLESLTELRIVWHGRCGGLFAVSLQSMAPLKLSLPALYRRCPVGDEFARASDTETRQPGFSHRCTAENGSASNSAAPIKFTQPGQ